jgi:hypothetical protein
MIRGRKSNQDLKRKNRHRLASLDINIEQAGDHRSNESVLATGLEEKFRKKKYQCVPREKVWLIFYGKKFLSTHNANVLRGLMKERA